MRTLLGQEAVTLTRRLTCRDTLLDRRTATTEGASSRRTLCALLTGKFILPVDVLQANVDDTLLVRVHVLPKRGVRELCGLSKRRLKACTDLTGLHALRATLQCAANSLGCDTIGLELRADLLALYTLRAELCLHLTCLHGCRLEAKRRL